MSAVGIGCGIVAVWWTIAIARDGMARNRRREERKKQQEQKKRDIVVEVEVELTGNADVAFKTLRQYGFSKEEATGKVLKALKQQPQADFQTLLNLALRHE